MPPMIVLGRAAKEASKKKVPMTRKESCGIYIHKVLYQVHLDTETSSNTTPIINSFVNDIFERNYIESNRLLHYNKSVVANRKTETTVQLLLLSVLAKHAVSEGTKAVTKYTGSK
ncbi:unnamed protein product [Taenia asiatica]|uniref:Histone H2B n=1 Tax=Taenia asiatica TaxID=60517 RepID=A0A0R3WEK9_TAEAS|nr:unnamed protein product [Taenia asiatica]